MTFFIIGGDFRNFILAQSLAKDGNKVSIYGFEKLKENFNEKIDLIKEGNLDEIKNSDIIIGPIPFSRDDVTINMTYSDKKISISEIEDLLKNKAVFVGNINDKLKENWKSKNIKVIDIMQKEEFVVLNVIPTVEATIEIILKNNQNKIIYGMECLIMGFGRIGKVLAHKLQGLVENCTCLVTNEVEKAWTIAYGYKNVDLNYIKNKPSNLSKYDIIINTIPQILLKEELRNVNKETLLIDLSSKPYGIDRDIVKRENLNFIEALGLPRKICAYNFSRIYERYNN